MKIKFDGNQEYQLNAVSAVAGLFRDLPSTRGISGVPFERGGGEFFIYVPNLSFCTTEGILR